MQISEKNLKMKNRWNEAFQEGLEEMPGEETVSVAGGESFWFWVGYAAGKIARAFS